MMLARPSCALQRSFVVRSTCTPSRLDRRSGTKADRRGRPQTETKQTQTQADAHGRQQGKKGTERDRQRLTD
ncbi:hypothetical protein L210DRAFT_3534360 [Boletus edulis BED1]|uniref:Uncharacterized protein n=1 Tax=Boletus edulis BED1 TaxID=1328754 RepID=A0AAD4BY33_BOLED|nr:hypothetical protein L210DRAFT_3534360 [Boletus edulis BED1]